MAPSRGSATASGETTSIDELLFGKTH